VVQRNREPLAYTAGYISAVTDSQVEQAYAALAATYIATFGSIEHVHADDLVMIRRHLGGRTGAVLDLGCGPGHLTGYLHDLGVQVTGVDLVPEFISHAKAAYPFAPFEVGSIASLGTPSHSLAGILAWYSLIHVAPRTLDRVLAGLRLATAPDGMLIVGFFEGDEIAPFDHKVFSAYTWPVEQYTRRLSDAGFVEVERIRRPRDAATRPHAAIAARAI
jgi:SAM-dependent methyltransferase